jgi:signal transduction histidine kinase
LSIASEEILSVNELRALYRAAEARSARLRIIVDARSLLDVNSLAIAGQEIIRRILSFVGAQSARLSMSGRGRHPSSQLEAGSGGAFVCFSNTCSADDGLERVALEVMSSVPRKLDKEDAEAIDLILRLLFDALRLEIQMRERADLLQKLTARESELATLVARMIEAQEIERRRVAHELHDGAAQHVVGIAYRLETLAASTADGSPMQETVGHLSKLARQAVAEIRSAIADLRPPELDDLGLVAAIHARLDSINTLHITPELAPVASRWPASVSTVLYRVAQEAITNVLKHAHATRLTVRVAEEPTGRAILEVIDDGRGIADVQKRPGRGLNVGLIGMRERLSLVGGQLEVEAAQGGGTVVRARVPLELPHTPLESAP